MNREHIAAYLVNAGHRTEVFIHNEDQSYATVHFRTRGHAFTISVTEQDQQFFAVSTPFEVPGFARDQSRSAPTLLDLQGTFKAIKFYFGENSETLVAAVEQFCTVDDFCEHLWRIVSVLRDAGRTALEQIVDRSESKAAADKFIGEFMKGQQ